MTIAKAAAEVMREQGETRIWLGNVNLWEDVYERRYGRSSGVRLRNNHPMNRAQAVFTALHRSPLFRHTGYIKSVGFSDREHRHPVFELGDLPADEQRDK